MAASKKPTPYRDLQEEIRRRKYPASFWINWFLKAHTWDITFDNIRRCLIHETDAEGRAALLWLRGEIAKIIAAKKRNKAKPEQGKRTECDQIKQVEVSNVVKPFILHLPKKPYCADKLSEGLKIRPAATALRHRHIQPNGPGMAWVRVFDVDHAVDRGWMESRAKRPNFVAKNPQNGHVHVFYCLGAGVCTTSAARLKPLRYMAAIDGALARDLDADLGYAGLIAKNPIHDDWDLVELHDHLWTLGELADGLDLSSPANQREAAGLGRNVSLFDWTRVWAYVAIRDYWSPGGFPSWGDAVLCKVEALNKEFSAPLPFSEVRAIAKSIAKWTWRNTTPAGLQDLIRRTHTPEKQAERGAKNSREKQSAKGVASGHARRLSRGEDRETACMLRIQGVRQREIAELLGLSQQTVSRWTRKSEMARALQGHLGMTEQEILDAMDAS